MAQLLVLCQQQFASTENININGDKNSAHFPERNFSGKMTCFCWRIGAAV